VRSAIEASAALAAWRITSKGAIKIGKTSRSIGKLIRRGNAHGSDHPARSQKRHQELPAGQRMKG
jgi:hypothetical protein